MSSLFASILLLALFHGSIAKPTGQRIIRCDFTPCPTGCCCYRTSTDEVVTECSYSEFVEAPEGVSPDTDVLDLKGNNIKTIEKSYFKNLSNLKKLVISYNKLVHLDEDLFEPLKKLAVLDIHKNKIKDIPENLFQHTKQLKWLKMKKLLLESLPLRLFHPLEKLETLYLGGNTDKLECNCAMITKSWKLQGTCSRWSELQCTFIEQPVQEKTNYSPKTPCPLPCKCYLHNDKKVTGCGYNKLVKLPNGVPLETEVLYLNHNKLTEIPAGYFDKLVKLQTLSLRGNELTTIRAGTFSKLKHLKKLYLNYNKLRSLEPKSFDGLESLKYLDLHGNEIDSLKSGTFTGLGQYLETLDMHNNNVGVVGRDTFSGLPSNLKLRLEGNSDIKCECSLIEIFKQVKIPGSFGKCSFEGTKERIMAVSTDVEKKLCKPDIVIEDFQT